MADCDIVQPAEPFLDMAGEDLRRRIFLTQSARGEEMCLRPEFTIPVCAAHIDAHNDTPERYGYYGQVFRQLRADGSGTTEFYQAGIEDLGNGDLAMADALSIRDALQLSQQINPKLACSVIVGDQALFAAVLKSLGLPEGWQERLIHAFGQGDVLDMMLDQLAAPEHNSQMDDAVKELLDRDDHQALVQYLSEKMDEMGYASNISRTADDIARRMLDKQRLAKVALSDQELAILREFLDIHIKLDMAEQRLVAFAGKAGLDLDPALTLFKARLRAMQSANIDLSELTYRAAFGRPLDYYTGLVFEIQNQANQEVLAAGGRYDRLMELLGADKAIPAVGFSLWLERFITCDGKGQ